MLESGVDKGLGTVVTALVEKGTLKIGDFVLAGPSWGKVRRLISDQGKDIREAGPATPIQVCFASLIAARSVDIDCWDVQRTCCRRHFQCDGR